MGTTVRYNSHWLQIQSFKALVAQSGQSTTLTGLESRDSSMIKEVGGSNPSEGTSYALVV